MIAEAAIVATVDRDVAVAFETEVLEALTVGEEPLSSRTLAWRSGCSPTSHYGRCRRLWTIRQRPSRRWTRWTGCFACATRDLAIQHVPGSDGTIRVELVLPTWDDCLSAARDEIIALPAQSPNVSRRILRLLDDLARITPAGKRDALQARRRLIRRPSGPLHGR